MIVIPHFPEKSSTKNVFGFHSKAEKMHIFSFSFIRKYAGYKPDVQDAENMPEKRGNKEAPSRSPAQEILIF